MITGAGASFDCGEKSNAFNHDYRPPLVAELFDSRPQFYEILHKYEGVSRLRQSIEAQIKRDPAIGLEQVLLSFATSSNHNVRRLFRDIPPYLQELIGTVRNKFPTVHGTKFDRLVQELDDCDHGHILYVTTNYDCFLDDAIESFYDHKFARMADYLLTGHRWSLIKLHGSTNWGRPILNGSISENPFRLELQGDALELGAIEVLRGGRNKSQWTRERAHYPALSVPVADKSTFACPEDHLTFLRQRLAACSTVLIAGFSALDLHVLELLQAAKNIRRLLIVNGSRQNGEPTFDRLVSGSWPYMRRANVEEIVIDMGFSSFLDRYDLRTFLNSELEGAQRVGHR
jgi:hypothetical protein